MSVSPGADRYLAAARSLAPQIESAAPQADRDRHIAAAIAHAMADAGLFHMLLPAEVDGGAAPFPAFLPVAEAVARADGSAAWCLVQGALSAARVVAYLPLATAREIFGHRRTILANGTGAGARAVVVDGGYRLTGEWPFASGCLHATWLKGAAMVYDQSGQPVRHPDGVHDHRTLLFEVEHARIVDVWHTGGLRGTGTNTVVVEGLFVPHHRTTSLTHDSLQIPYPLAALPDSTDAAAGFCAVALGIARGALDAFIDVAQRKTPRGASATLRESPVIQTQVARAEARLRAARAFLYEIAQDVWGCAENGLPLTIQQRALFRLAATDGIHQAAHVVDTVYHAAGATAVFESQPFERRFRDVHTVTQQTQAQPRHYEAVGRVVLGMNADGAV